MTTESRVEEANRAMAAIADDATATDRERRVQLGAIWIPIAHQLIDNLPAVPEDACGARNVPDPHFVGVTCDSRRPVFLDKEISGSGLVYRKFVIAGEERRSG